MLSQPEVSRAPARHPNEIDAEVGEAVLEMRREHPHWGPAKLRARLERAAPEVPWPVPSTMGEMLKRAGLTVPRRMRRKATPSASPLAHAAALNQVWCADFKGWFRCGDGSRCDPFTLTDAYNRYLLRCQVLPSLQERGVRGVEDGPWRLWYFDYPIGLFDERKATVRKLNKIARQEAQNGLRQLNLIPFPVSP